MGRLLIVSNRLPVNISKRDGKLRVEHSVGGLATGIGSFYKNQESLWVGWSGFNIQNLPPDEHQQVMDMLAKHKCYPVNLTPNEVKQYYGGFCNNTLWPLFHYFFLYAKYDQKWWDSYCTVNQKFCDALVAIAQPDDTFWIHDYHLMLLPQMIRERLPNAKIGFFLHIPFPSYELFRLLPWRAELLEGLLGSDLVGFHTYDYVRHFLSSVRRILGHEHTMNEVQTGTQLVRVDLFPMGIDYQRFLTHASSNVVRRDVERTRRKFGTQKIILSFDRLDYTKGIPLRLEAFDVLLSKKPEYRGKVSLVVVAVPSRTNVKQYQLLKKQIDELVGRINGKYATTDWTPVHYFSHVLPFDTLIAFYNIADVAVVTPLRDGMNLMAKEFLASKVNALGTLVLSEMAGAAQELGEAIIVNPNSQDELVNAIDKALKMPPEEQQRLNRIMQKRLMRYDINRWVADFLTRLDDAWSMQQTNTQSLLTSAVQKQLVADYADSNRRLFLLDYDGTLVSFADKPEHAPPTQEVRSLLKALAASPQNEVVITSGRNRNTLLEWFGNLDIGLIAEHGAWIRERSGKMHAPRLLSDEWKKEILPLVELCTDRTPGSFIEEKPDSLVWHYRKTDPVLGSLRAKELKDDLVHLTSNFGLVVVEGKKVIEIKNAIVNKGRAASHWLSKGWGFILALGDDKTDEDLFGALPPMAYSIKVGLGPSKARYNLTSQRDVLPLLAKLQNSGHEKQKEKKN